MALPGPASFAGTARAAVSKPVLSWSEKRLDVKSRWYRIKNRLSAKQLAQISDSFKTLKIMAQTNYVVSGRDIVALQLGFDVSLTAGEEDFARAKDLDVDGAVLDMVDDCELNAKGNFVPVPERAIHLEGVPYSLFEADKVLEEGLSAYVTIPEGARKWGSPDGIYSGKVRLRIKDIKSPVPEFVTVIFEGSKVRLRTNISGMPQESSRVKVCFKCRGNHHAPECPKKMKFKWKCTKCGLDSIFCKDNDCKMEAPAANVRDLMTEIKATQDDIDNGRTYANAMDKIKKALTDRYSNDHPLSFNMLQVIRKYTDLDTKILTSDNKSVNSATYIRTRSRLFTWIENLLSDPNSNEHYRDFMEWHQKKSKPINKN